MRLFKILLFITFIQFIIWFIYAVIGNLLNSTPVLPNPYFPIMPLLALLALFPMAIHQAYGENHFTLTTFKEYFLETIKQQVEANPDKNRLRSLIPDKNINDLNKLLRLESYFSNKKRLSIRFYLADLLLFVGIFYIAIVWFVLFLFMGVSGGEIYFRYLPDMSQLIPFEPLNYNFYIFLLIGLLFPIVLSIVVSWFISYPISLFVSFNRFCDYFTDMCDHYEKSIWEAINNNIIDPTQIKSNPEIIKKILSQWYSFYCAIHLSSPKIDRFFSLVNTDFWDAEDFERIIQRLICLKFSFPDSSEIINKYISFMKIHTKSAEKESLKEMDWKKYHISKYSLIVPIIAVIITVVSTFIIQSLK